MEGALSGPIEENRRTRPLGSPVRGAVTPLRGVTEGLRPARVRRGENTVSAAGFASGGGELEDGMGGKKLLCIGRLVPNG